MNERPDADNASDEHYVSFFPSLLGYGGIRMDADGNSTDFPEHEALLAAIPMWVTVDEHEDDALDLCLEFAAHPLAEVRAAAVTAIGDLARRYGRLKQHERVSGTLRHALADADADVRQAATRSLQTLEETLGWNLPSSP